MDVLVERSFEAPVTADEVRANARRAADRLAPHRVRWMESYLGSDGARVLGRFTAPDAESVRDAFRRAGEPFHAIWCGSFDPGPGEWAESVAVERRFDRPVVPADLRSIEDVCIRCWIAHGVRRTGSFVSPDGRGTLGLYRAPDSESVRLGLRRAGLSFASVWSLRSVAVAR